MSEFELYELAIKQYEQSISSEEKTSDEDIQERYNCDHKNIKYEKGMNICTDCGLEISEIVSHNKEWRFYGQSDNCRTSDPNRVIVRKDSETNIFKDVENMGFSDKIVSQANIIYKQVTNGKIFRNNYRKSIIFASIFHSYKLNNTPQSHEKLINIFNLDKKTALKGLKHVSLNAPKKTINNTYITPINFIGETMEKFHATEEHIKEVVEIYNKIKNKSSRINRSRPLSISSSVIWFWICKTKRDISLKEFTSKINLSDLTVTKLAKEIGRILGEEYEL